MLDDRERGLLFEIERRLLLDDPELVRSFGAAPHHETAVHRRETDVIATIAGLTLYLVLLRGPRRPTDAETAVLGSAAALRALPTTRRDGGRGDTAPCVHSR